MKGNGFGIVLEGLGKILIEKMLMFKFTASNNWAEYKALIAGMALALLMVKVLIHGKKK